jgi:hydroxyacylglutathione hydrolase
MLQVEAIETPAAGHRGYLIHDGTTAVVVDPPWDNTEVTSLAVRLGVAISLVAETHLHPGQILPGGPTCGSALARQAGARYAVSAAHRVCPGQLSVADTDELAAGRLTVMVIATPGHTLSHLAFAFCAPDGQAAVCTGGSLRPGGVGRTDLAGGPELTLELAGAQFRSAHRLAARLPGSTTVHPTHGWTGGRASTLAFERTSNPALTEPSEYAFSARLAAALAS